MSKKDYLSALRGQLVIAGMPLSYIRKAGAELSDHWDDLETEVLQSGLTLPDIADHVARQLGAPETLAHLLQENFRRHSWFGRHRILSFTLFPILALALWWFLCLFTEG